MKSENAEKILKNLKEVGVRLIVSLPDSWLVDLEELAKKDPEDPTTLLRYHWTLI